MNKALPIAVAALLLAPTLAEAQKKKKPAPPPRWAKMDLGPTFSSTIQVGPTNIPKAIAVRVGEAGQAAVCYDEDLVRMAGGWTGGFVKIHPGRNALLGNDAIEGTLLFSTTDRPGWAPPGKLEDPRPKGPKGRRAGPLPRSWARYTGLYMHGNKVVLAWTVGKGTVLEHPWAVEIDGRTVITRTFNVSNLETTHHLLLARGDGVGAAIAKGARGVKLVDGPDKTILAEVTPSAGVFTVALWGGKPGEIASIPAGTDPATLTKGGPRRWKETLTTKGRLGTGTGAYVVDTLTPPFENPWRSILHFGGHDFFSNGDAAICTMEGDVWLVKGIDDDLDAVTWQRIATGMYHPLGVKIVKDVIHVICRDQIAKLHDLNGDGEIDYYECFNNDIHVATHPHEFTTCLETDPDGNFFFLKGTNGAQTIHDSSVLRVSADGTKLERWATGFRWPNGMGMSPTGVLTTADQQGTWVPSSRLDWIERDGFYGFMNSHHRETPPKTYDGPLCWIPHPVDNSCGGQTWVESEKWGPVNGMLLHLSYGKCTLFLVLHEKVGDVRQGGVVQFPVGPFESGAMRARFRKTDGQLYISGLKGWQTSGARDGCFQRVRYTGKKISMPVGLNAKKKGVILRFADPLDPETANDKGSWSARRWNYRWTSKYGSKHYSVANPEKQGEDELTITDARLLPDGKSVFVGIADMKPVMQMAVGYSLRSGDGRTMRGTVYHTIHALGD